jgi:hypothetical protein
VIAYVKYEKQNKATTKKNTTPFVVIYKNNDLNHFSHIKEE